MDTDDARLDEQLRAHARRSLQAHQLTVDPDRELATFDAKLDDEGAVVPVTPSNSWRQPISRWWPAAAAAAVVLVVAGVLALTRDGGGHRIGSPAVTVGDTTSPTSRSSRSADSSAHDSTLPGSDASTTLTTTATPDATVPIESGIVRPYVDPARCRPENVARYGIDDGTLRLFAGPREAPIPIQIIGDPVDGPTKPFAVVERFFGPVTIVAPTVAEVYENGNGVATWTLPDGSTAYLRSRGLSQDELLDVIGRLSPRDRDAAVPGFDYQANADNRLQLVEEGLNTHVTGHSDVLTCSTANGGPYSISTLVGDPLYIYGGVIDRAVPLDVGNVEGTVIVISGQASPDAPTPSDIVNADPAVWQTIPTSTVPAPPVTS